MALKDLIYEDLLIVSNFKKIDFKVLYVANKLPI
jgi:hypothetical protein